MMPGARPETARAGDRAAGHRETTGAGRFPEESLTCSNHMSGSAARWLVVLPGTVRARARVGPWPGDRVVRAVRLRPGPRVVPGPRQPGSPERGVPGARLPVGVVQPPA